MDTGNNGFFELISAISDDVSKGLLYTQTRINDNAKKVLESSSFLYALIELLSEKRLIDRDRGSGREKDEQEVRTKCKKENRMKENIKRQDLGNEFYTPEKCFVTELSNTPDDPDASIARARVKPGVTTRWHRLTGTVERYYIVSGEGRVEIGDWAPQEVYPGDIVLIPPMCRQRIANIGSEDLVFLAICTPRFLNEAYTDVEEEPI